VVGRGPRGKRGASEPGIDRAPGVGTTCIGVGKRPVEAQLWFEIVVMGLLPAL
jgi:hypothetical protein